MALYQHILAATDLSDNSSETIEQSAKMAKAFGAKLSLIHVVEPIPAYGYPGLTEIESPIIDQAKKELSELASKHDIAEEQLHIELGSIKTEVLKKSKEINADLIIIGSHGRHGLQRLLGSTASAVVHGADIDVFVIRAK